MRLLTLALSLVLCATAFGQQPTALPQPPTLTINGKPLSARDRQIIGELERMTGRRAIPGHYWYDNATGALGTWGGPTVIFLQPGLGLGGALPPNASGGGYGMLTGVFINGRELHPGDVQALQAMLGTRVLPGRWWVDAMGNAGYEGGPALMNLFAIARQNNRGGSGNPYYRSNGKGDNTFVGKGCAAVNGSTGTGYDKKSYSYFVGCD